MIQIVAVVGAVPVVKGSCRGEARMSMTDTRDRVIEAAT
jgi:hypothetical protein